MALQNTTRVRPLVPRTQDAYGFDVQRKADAHPITFADARTQPQEDESMKDDVTYEC